MSHARAFHQIDRQCRVIYEGALCCYRRVPEDPLVEQLTGRLDSRIGSYGGRQREAS